MGLILLFATKFPETLGTDLIDLGEMKGLVDLGAIQRMPGFPNGLQNVLHKQSQ